jgi:hypothetical protein
MRREDGKKDKEHWRCRGGKGMILHYKPLYNNMEERPRLQVGPNNRLCENWKEFSLRGRRRKTIRELGDESIAVKGPDQGGKTKRNAIDIARFRACQMFVNLVVPWHLTDEAGLAPFKSDLTLSTHDKLLHTVSKRDEVRAIPSKMDASMNSSVLNSVAE